MRRKLEQYIAVLEAKIAQYDERIEDWEQSGGGWGMSGNISAYAEKRLTLEHIKALQEILDASY